jgi:DNA-binding response OmpR family regulator
VSPSPAVPAVLIVDEDVGFVWWLGEIFHDLGCRAVPALSCQDAISIAKTANLAPDLIIVNPVLPGVAGMIKALRRGHSAKIVAIQERRASRGIDPEAHAVLERPMAGEPIRRSHWIRIVRGLLAQIGTRAAC